MSARAVEISDGMTAAQLRAAARSADCGMAAARMHAIANALEGMKRCEAARLAGFERQALRDAILAFNEFGLDGLYDAPRPGRPCKLDAAQRAELGEIVRKGPDPETDGISAYTLDDLVALVRERFKISYRPESISAILKKDGFSRQKARPMNPKTDLAAQEAFKKSPRAARGNCRYT